MDHVEVGQQNSNGSLPSGTATHVAQRYVPWYPRLKVVPEVQVLIS
jgi:hypothetical protein